MDRNRSMDRDKDRSMERDRDRDRSMDRDGDGGALDYTIFRAARINQQFNYGNFVASSYF